VNKWQFKPEQLAAYRGSGYELIPLHVPDAVDARGRKIGKAPFKGWRTDPHLTVDEAVTHMKEGGNVGVRLRACDLVIDVDPRNFLEGDDPYARIQSDLNIDFSDYPRVITGSGGFHVYMLMPEGTLLRDTLEDYQGIEFKAQGRQVVSAGSAHPDTERPYLWDDDFLAVSLPNVSEAPHKLIELARRPGRIAAVDAGDYTPEQLGEMLEGLDAKEFRDHTRWLELMMASHHATAGEGRDEFLEWSTSDPSYAKDAWLIGRRWDSLHADTSGRRVTVKTLFKRLNEVGEGERIPRESAQDDFPEEIDFDEQQPGDQDSRDLAEMIASLPEGSPANGPLEALNAKGYAAVNDNGQFRVYRRKVDYTWPDKPREYWETQRKGDFLDILSNLRIQKTKGDSTSTVPLAGEWLKWGSRTSYDGVAFDPGNRIPKPANVLNLWTDWAVEPKKGEWNLLKRLLLEGLCDDEKAMFEYVLNWSAFMVQHPEKPAEVALVFRGAKGTGKGTYFRALGELAGRHGMHISNQHHFTNHFNSHLRDCIFLFADEAMWAGDKKAEGTLKALITEPTMVIEGKGKDVVVAKNHLHIAMASNEDWVFPASMDDERRLAISDVNSKFRGNKAFFTALNKQLVNGGLQAMLFDLKTRDIKGFHPRANIPQTQALANQKLQSLDSWDSWWYDSLCTGDATSGQKEAKGLWNSTNPTHRCVLLCDDMKDSLEQHLRKVGDRHFGRRSMDTVMGQRLARRVPHIKKVRLACPEDRLDVKTSSGGRVYAYWLPSLTECRGAFEAQLGSKLPWDASVRDMSDDIVDLDADVMDLD
jgi:hypothetical protein